MEAIAVALVVTAIIGPWLIPLLRRLKFGQTVRTDGPARHLAKTGTPTMGGLMFLGGIFVASAIFSFRDWAGITVVLITLGFAALGFADDYIKVVLKRSLGLRAREKLLGQLIISLILAIVAVKLLGRGTEIWLPFTNGATLDFGFGGYLVFVVLVMTASTNAVNLTDGLDGLAASVTTVTAVAMTIIALMAGFSGVAWVMAAVAGGCLGFLLFNHYPAKVFMGDTGSLALGGALGAAAVLTRSELFLIIVGLIYVVEALSVIIQVFSFQLFHHRVFKMSPLHHHFELCNWTENKIVMVFTGVTLIASIIGIVLFYFFQIGSGNWGGL